VEGRTDYKKVLAEKMPKWFVEKETMVVFEDGSFLESKIYNPLGISLK
jgi:hypothetical protein